MKSYNMWRCEDCRKVGFYFDLTDEEIRDKHIKECPVRLGPPLPPTRWPNAGESGGAEL